MLFGIVAICLYSINQLIINLKLKKMFSTENLKKMGTTLVIVMVALAVHQKFVAPMIASKKSIVPPTKA